MEPLDVGLAGKTAEMKTSLDTFFDRVLNNANKYFIDKATLGIIITICTKTLNLCNETFIAVCESKHEKNSECVHGSIASQHHIRNNDLLGDTLGIPK